MRIAIELMFYILINLAPGKVNHFEVKSFSDLKTKQDERVFNFDRQTNGHWKITRIDNPQAKSMEFWFDKDKMSYYEKRDGRAKRVYAFARQYQIKPDRKNWRKAKKVTYTLKEADGKPSKISVVFKIDKKRKKAYQVKAIGKDVEVKNFPVFKISWN